MNVMGAGQLSVAVKRNGEVYDLLSELLGECSACDLHLAMSLVAKMREYGLATPMEALVLQPTSVMQRRQRRRRQSQLAFSPWPPKAWFQQQDNQTASSSRFEHSWNDLPQDLVLRVASHLGSEDRQVMACTCGVWKDTLGSNTSEVSFAWAGRREVDKFDLAPMVDKVVRGASVIYPAISKVDLRRCELLTSDALACLVRASCSQLKELDLSGCKALTDTGVIAVAESCTQLERLQLASCQGLTDCSFVALGSFCSKLSVLSACGCEQLTDLGLRCLSQGSRGLKEVNLGWCEALTEQGIEALAHNCPDLASVDLCGCLQVGDNGIAALAMRCPGLRSLGLHCCRRLTDASQAALAVHLRHLTSLNISGCRALTPAAVQEVIDSNPGLHTCGGINRNVIVAGCLNLLSVSCSCPTAQPQW